MNSICAITGSHGLIGKKLVEKLTENQFPIIQLERQDTTPVSWKLSSDIETLVHCAAYMPSNFGCFSQATKCMMDNGIATLDLLKDADKSGVRTFVYLSSGQIYKWKNDPMIEALESDEMDPTTRSSPYLISKLVGDSYVRSFKSTCNMRVVVLRLSSVYGQKSHGLLDRLIKTIDQNGTIPNYNVDLVHTNDVVSMIVNSITNQQISGVYNVGGGHTTSTFEIIKNLARIMDKPYTISSALPLELGHAGLNIEKAKSVGYQPCSLTDGLSSYTKSL
jgi:UDP-glucose 4-epimerase